MRGNCFLYTAQRRAIQRFVESASNDSFWSGCLAGWPIGCHQQIAASERASSSDRSGAAAGVGHTHRVQI